MKNVNAQAKKAHGGKPRRKIVHSSSAVAAFVQKDLAVFIVIDEGEVREIARLDVSWPAIFVDFLVLDVFGGYELFEVVELFGGGEGDSSHDIFRRTTHIGEPRRVRRRRRLAGPRRAWRWEK
jgi:hypothetical protein